MSAATAAAAPAAHAIGIDVGGTKIEAVLLDADGSLLWRHRVPSPADRYEDMLAAIVGLVEAGRRALQGQPEDIGHHAPASIGLGTPGSATPSGLIKNANTTCLNGRPLQADLAARLGQPVRLANDANCLALSEAVDGAGAGAEVVFAAILGTGTGAGIAVRQRVLTGPNGVAGEWGHNPLPWREPQDAWIDCYCGQAGCIETLISGPGLALDHQRHGGSPWSAEAIAAQAALGEAACLATLARWQQRLARALAGVINLLDPDVIVLGGGLSKIASTYTAVPALWGQWVVSGGLKDPVRTRLLPALHGDASGVRGAAWLWRGSVG